MAAADMLTVQYDLNIQPGRIPPIVHLKEDSTSVLLTFRLKATNEDYPDDVVSLENDGTAILKGTRQDGSSVFIAKAVKSVSEDFIIVEYDYSDMESMLAEPAAFRCTISIIDADYSSSITRQTYEDYDLITVQPFYLWVHETAYGSENLTGSVGDTVALILEE